MGETRQAARQGRSPWPGLAAASLALLVSGCLRPTGDFDRARPSVIHDKLMPEAGEAAAKLRGEPVSAFNYTNDENELRDRAWALIRPPWTKDWIGGTKVELARTRVLPETDGKVPPELYYHYLRSDRFKSSDARFDKVAADARGDAELVPPFCELTRRVEQADNERLRALNSKQITTVEIYEGAKARVWENRRLVSWVSQALRYRILAYQTAIDSLEIETPTGDRMWQANTAIRELEVQTRLAEAGCKEENRYGTDQPARRSRIYTGWGLEREPPKK